MSTAQHLVVRALLSYHLHIVLVQHYPSVNVAKNVTGILTLHRLHLSVSLGGQAILPAEGIYFPQGGDGVERKKRKTLLEQAASKFELPVEAVAGVSCVQLVGREELLLQNHRGILSYGEDEILVSGSRMLIRVKGNALKLRSMTPTDLVITGTIDAVELE